MLSAETEGGRGCGVVEGGGGVVYHVPQLSEMTTLIYFGPAVDDRLQRRPGAVCLRRLWPSGRVLR